MQCANFDNDFADGKRAAILELLCFIHIWYTTHFYDSLTSSVAYIRLLQSPHQHTCIGITPTLSVGPSELDFDFGPVGLCQRASDGLLSCLSQHTLLDISEVVVTMHLCVMCTNTSRTISQHSRPVLPCEN